MLRPELLSPMILLCLVQQLSTDLDTHRDLKLRWLFSALVSDGIVTR